MKEKIIIKLFEEHFGVNQYSPAEIESFARAVIGGLSLPAEAKVSCVKCNRYKFALERAVKWNHQYLTEVFDNKEYEKMIKDKSVGDEYKQLIVEIRYLLSS